MNTEKVMQILIVVAHSDDETIGMGGTIRRHVAQGDLVHVICMTDGVGARAVNQTDDAQTRAVSAAQASEILGFNWIKGAYFDDNMMDKYPLLEIVKVIESAKGQIAPDIVYTHSGADLNVDHRVVATSVLTAFRPNPDEKCCEIRLFEVASATDYGHETLTGRFSPNLFINTAKTWDSKEAALKAYNPTFPK